VTRAFCKRAAAAHQLVGPIPFLFRFSVAKRIRSDVIIILYPC
jgi:hypothetical protein